MTFQNVKDSSPPPSTPLLHAHKLGSHLFVHLNVRQTWECSRWLVLEFYTSEWREPTASYSVGLVEIQDFVKITDCLELCIEYTSNHKKKKSHMQPIGLRKTRTLTNYAQTSLYTLFYTVIETCDDSQTQ